MRVALDPGDRLLLIISATLLIAISLVAVLIVPMRARGVQGVPDSYSTENDGGKAAYLLIQDLGYQEERWTSPATELPEKSSNVILILADPFLPASEDEKTAIRWFVRNGGKVITTGALGARLLNLSGVGFAKGSGFGEREFEAQMPGQLSYLAPSVFMQTNYRWKQDTSDGREYFGDEKGGVVVKFVLGKGSIIWWAASSPLSNLGITQSSNLNLLLNSLGGAENKRVLWDEYYHGQRSGFWSYLAKTPLPWALLQAILLAAAVVLTYSRRRGPIFVPVEESRLSPLEFVETVGDLYARKRAAAGAVGIAYHRFRTQLARMLGLSPDVVKGNAGPAVRGRIEAVGAGLTPLLADCELAVANNLKNETQALKLIQKLHDYARRLRLTGKGD